MTSMEVLIEVGNNLVILGELDFECVNLIQYKGIFIYKLMVGFTHMPQGVWVHSQGVWLSMLSYNSNVTWLLFYKQDGYEHITSNLNMNY